MADEYFKFEFDDTFEEMKQYIKSFKERFDKIVKEELYKFGLEVESVAKELAPVDSGDLENSITTSKVLFEGDEFYITIGTNNEYALRRHEEPRPILRMNLKGSEISLLFGFGFCFLNIYLF